MSMMKDLREAGARLNADTPIFIKQGNVYYKVKKVWPDTTFAAMGRALYLEIEQIPDLIKTDSRIGITVVTPDEKENAYSH